MLTIGTAQCIGDPTNWAEKQNDRIEQTRCINGTYTEDIGYDASGMVINCTITVTESDYQALLAYRISGTRVTIVDHYGNTLTNRLFKLCQVHHEVGTNYRTLDIEIYAS